MPETTSQPDERDWGDDTPAHEILGAWEARRIPQPRTDTDLRERVEEHEFIPVAGHPDDDECTHRADGTDATYCGQTCAWHDHHPRCCQNIGTPDDLPSDLCDCRVFRLIASGVVLDPAEVERGEVDAGLREAVRVVRAWAGRNEDMAAVLPLIEKRCVALVATDPATVWDEGHATSCAYFPECGPNGHHRNPYRAATPVPTDAPDEGDR